MRRRTLLQWFAAVPAILPFESVRLFAQRRELTADAIADLREIASTVLPSTLGDTRVRDVTDKFVAWTRGYREGVALTHGYGHPRLQKSGQSPVPTYLSQLAALGAEARARGGRWSGLDLETRRSLLDASLVKAGVRGLPSRPSGQHVVADLMAFHFRSSEANDDCYHALINREVCRPIAITIRKPEALR
ncbi:MAG TPA: hypothetical protein VGP77_11410 [Vicinamibacterales bacterium]|nr:hypothetical protein [Vicinamibacterales bacterium]